MNDLGTAIQISTFDSSAERGMQDLRNALDQQHQRALMGDMPLVVELELAIHQLNHRPGASWAG